jgi:DNA repair protein RadC
MPISTELVVMQVNDCGANWATGSAISIQPIGQMIGNVLKSQAAGKRLTAQIFGNVQIYTEEAAAKILRSRLEYPEGLGLTPSQIAALQSAVGLGKYLYSRVALPGIRIDEPAVAATLLCPAIGWSPVEQFAVVVLDVKHNILGLKVLFQGTCTETLANPREIFQTVLLMGGSRLVVAHNHPSGSLEPSPEDIQLTNQLLKASQVMNIELLDHLIIAGAGFRSLRENTGLWP